MFPSCIWIILHTLAKEVSSIFQQTYQPLKVKPLSMKIKSEGNKNGHVEFIRSNCKLGQINLNVEEKS